MLYKVIIGTLIFILSQNFLVSFVYAEGGGEHEAPAETADAHKEGGKEAKAPVSEYMTLYSDIERLNGGIKAKQEVIKKLFEDKAKAKDANIQREIVKTIQTEVQALKEMTEEYEKKKITLRYRFPDKGGAPQAQQSSHKEGKGESEGDKSDHGAHSDTPMSGEEEQLLETVKVMRRQYQPVIKKMIPKNKAKTGK